MSIGTLKKRLDPLLHDAGLPLTATFFPLGFRLEIATNSREVLQAAGESWGAWTQGFDRPPLRVGILVEPGGDEPREPVFRARGRQFAIVSGPTDFAMYESRSLEGCCFVTERTAADRAWFRWYFLEALVYMLLAQRYVVPVHAACVARGGRGVLLCGASGAGKSSLAWACARAGWAFLSDDACFLLSDAPGRRVIGKPYQARFRMDAPALFPELAGFAASAHPGGKLSMEVPLAAFPELQSAQECEPASVVFLKRAAAPARFLRVEASDAVERLLRDMPSYGDEVNAIHERAVERLSAQPACELHYNDLTQAARLLEELIS